MLRNIFIAAAVVSMVGANAYIAQAAENQDFTIHNNTGFKIMKLYVEPESNTKDWGDEMLKGETIDNGDTYSVKFSGYGDECKFAVSITDPAGKDYEVRDIDLCKINDLKFTKSGAGVKWEAN
ncbi:MAG: hypothetical protein JWM80_948 [Cyanobacteria bacterium RYN_339]|nr:hypothetical protein [Cyanobacteria bacterium RYN_339]